MNARDSQNDRDVPGVLFWPPGIFFIVLAVSVGMQVLAPLRALPAWPARIAGGLLVVIAPALALWARNVMHAAGTNVHPTMPSVVIVTSGPFRYTRNPMYTALCLLHLGIGLLIDGAWPIAMTAVLFVVLWWGVVSREERYLTRKFGEPYVAFTRRVRRWGLI